MFPGEKVGIMSYFSLLRNNPTVDSIIEETINYFLINNLDGFKKHLSSYVTYIIPIFKRNFKNVPPSWIHLSIDRLPCKLVAALSATLSGAKIH